MRTGTIETPENRTTIEETEEVGHMEKGHMERGHIRVGRHLESPIPLIHLI